MELFVEGYLGAFPALFEFTEYKGQKKLGCTLDMFTVVTVDFLDVRVIPLIYPRIIILLWVIIHQIAQTVALGDLSPKKL